MSKSVQGRIVWHDLHTTNVDHASAFYGELFGWRIKTEGHWSLIYPASGDEHFGSMMPLRPDEKSPPHWVPYLAVADLDHSIASVTSAGGQLYLGKTPAGKTGNFAVAADSTGAVFTLWQYTGGQGKAELDVPPPPGAFCWDELVTTDPIAAEKFYTHVIGYGTEHVEMPDMRYTLWTRPQASPRPDGKVRQAGGMMKSPAGMPHSFWLSYIAVADCDDAAAQAARLGGQIMIPPRDIPNVGRFAGLTDPTGAGFAVLAPPK